MIPEIKISSSPSGRTLLVGEALNLTCIAWPRSEDELYPRRRIKYIQWYDPKNRSTLQLILTCDGDGVGFVIISKERYDQVKIKPKESEEKYRYHLRLRRLRSFEELSES